MQYAIVKKDIWNNNKMSEKISVAWQFVMWAQDEEVRGSILVVTKFENALFCIGTCLCVLGKAP